MGLGEYARLFDLDAVESELERGLEAQVQFDRPFSEPARILKLTESGTIEEGPEIDYPGYLARLNGLCTTYGARLDVRFYAHYSRVFDAEVLAALPALRSLTANCLENATNLEAIADLHHLSKLHLGVRALNNRAILASLPLQQLTAFTFEETASKAMDLKPLASAGNLRHLRLFGHKKNIDALGELPRLEEFAFNPFRDVRLDFLNGMHGLRALKLVLGGTQNLENVSLPNLRDLALTQVRGFADLGDLQRFPSLTRLLLQDQQQIESLRCGVRNTSLEHLWFYNCQALSSISGLAGLPALKSLHAVRTALRLDGLTLPPGLSHLSLFSGRASEERKEAAAIAARGLVPQPHPEMPFFYK